MRMSVSGDAGNAVETGGIHGGLHSVGQNKTAAQVGTWAAAQKDRSGKRMMRTQFAASRFANYS
jgi:hypothetical protein